eukprot:Gb_12222 [translate_table: standard]
MNRVYQAAVKVNVAYLGSAKHLAFESGLQCGFFLEGTCHYAALVTLTQVVTFIAVYPKWKFATIEGIRWRCIAVIWCLRHHLAGWMYHESLLQYLRGKFHSFHPVATVVSYLTKAALDPHLSSSRILVTVGSIMVSIVSYVVFSFLDLLDPLFLPDLCFMAFLMQGDIVVWVDGKGEGGGRGRAVGGEGRRGRGRQLERGWRRGRGRGAPDEGGGGAVIYSPPPLPLCLIYSGGEAGGMHPWQLFATALALAAQFLGVVKSLTLSGTEESVAIDCFWGLHCIMV